MLTTKNARSLLLLAGGTAILALSLTACGSGSGITVGGQDDDQSDFFGSVGLTTSHEYDTFAEAQEAVTKGTLPQALPQSASKISVETDGKKTFASWRGAQAEIDSCKPSSTEVPTAPSAVAHKGTVSDVHECGDVFQATVGAYSYYWGAVSK